MLSNMLWLSWGKLLQQLSGSGSSANAAWSEQELVLGTAQVGHAESWVSGKLLFII